ncbi:hypothetical protein [Streptomyces sp. NPDC007905]|uniref:hypothetical protein n=1 Tax=Streptomyces sp. NPDC007905 TaxID=3364788 RepID=UPI0036E512F1
MAWLALNGSPAGVIPVLTANFSARGGSCAVVAYGPRRHHGFPDEACAFFCFLAEPAPDPAAQATARFSRRGRAAAST